jgi:hypothetical protein
MGQILELWFMKIDGLLPSRNFLMGLVYGLVFGLDQSDCAIEKIKMEP